MLFGVNHKHYLGIETGSGLRICCFSQTTRPGFRMELPKIQFFLLLSQDTTVYASEGLYVRKCTWIPTRSLRICQTAHVKPWLVLILRLHWRLWNTHTLVSWLTPWREWGRHFISCFVQISFWIFHHLKVSLKQLSSQGPGGQVSQILPPSFFSFLLPGSGVESCFEGGTVTKELFYGWKWSEER